MAELAPGEMLLPSLLDRLMDNDPSVKSEYRNQRIESIGALRQAVLRDLECLLNTTNAELHVNLDEYPQVAESVVNYGIPNISGQTITGVDLASIEKLITEAIRRFEPRILPNTIRVSTIAGEKVSHANTVVFQIEATLWGKPMPEALFLRTELDLELGELVLRESD